LVRLSEVLALETQQHGIAVFAVDPGGARTALTDAVYGSPAGRRWLPGFAERGEQANATPARAVALCLQLASGLAGAVSGCFLGVADDLPGLVAQAADLRTQEHYTLRLRPFSQREQVAQMAAAELVARIEAVPSDVPGPRS